MTDRPPIGFIVEGHGEYNCYPSLFCRITNANGLHIPRINAGGCGSIVKRIKEQLTDLFIAESPLSVIITVDLEDVLKQGLAATCVDLLQDLNNAIDEWKLYAEADTRLHPLPDRIVCVVQIKKFESWLISDLDGLKVSNLIATHIESIEDAEQIASPCEWLKENLLVDGCVKSPNIAKTVISSLNPDSMRTHSKSFDKFYRESVSAYEKWVSSLT